MLLTLGLWTLAMIAGLCWGRAYVAILTGAAVLAFLGAQASVLASAGGWLQLAGLAMFPPLLAAQRSGAEARLKRLQGEEAAEVAGLSEAARSLLSLQKATQATEARIAEITELYHITKETSRALRTAELFAALLELAPRLLAARGLRLIDLSGAAPQSWRALRSPDGRMAPVPPGGAACDPMEQAVMEAARASAAPSGADATQLGCALPEGVSRVCWARLLREQRPAGLLVAEELPAEQEQTLAIIADQLSLQLSRIHLYRRVEELAVTDALTGVSVRNAFLERARDELGRSGRHGLPCTVLMADLDCFKQKNDTFGHLVGDVVLRDVARLLQRNLRDIDMIGRYGGEEFILLLIETDLDQALAVAERLRQLVEAHPIRAYDELLTQTVSIGAAVFPRHGKTLEELMERADQALYAAKRAGRNRVVAYDG
jgi:diguanylate cyclase (GGDEF)-like protein